MARSRRPCGSSPSFDDHARGGRAGHHRVVSDQRIRYPADRVRVRRLRGAATRDDAGLEDRLAVPRRRRLHRRSQSKLHPTKSHRELGDGGVNPGLADHSDLCGLPGAVHPPVERDQVHDITAATLGIADAADAVVQAQALGMLPGSAIYGDMENYSSTDAACRAAVLTYVSAWTKELHRLGYLAGMYANLSSGAKHLSEAYASTAYARPDALWIARWDDSTDADRLGWHPQRALVQPSAWEAVPRRP